MSRDGRGRSGQEPAEVGRNQTAGSHGRSVVGSSRSSGSDESVGFSVVYERKKRFWDLLSSRPVVHLIALLAMLGSLGPFLGMFVQSLMSSDELSRLAYPPSTPLAVGWERYTGLIGDPAFQTAFGHSAIIAVASTAIVAALGVPAGYVFSRYRFQYDNLLFLGVIFTRIIPSLVMIVPYYRMLAWLDLVNTLTGILIAHVYLWLPFVIVLMRFFFDAVPREIDEAAKVDGCTDVQALAHAVLPVAWPGLTATAVLTFIFSWREYLFATTIASNNAAITLPVYAARWGDSPEFIVVTVATAIGMAVIFQRHMTRSFEFVSGGMKR